MSSRAKVNRGKESCAKNKKHNRFDSIANEMMKKKAKDPSWSKPLLAEEKVKAKKKCKTQGEESM